jgi:cell division protein FtsB
MNIYVKRRLLILALGLFISYVAYELVNGYFRGRTVLKRYAALELRKSALRKTNQELRLKLAEAQSAGFIELNARARLGLVKPGETAYKIIEEE